MTVSILKVVADFADSLLSAVNEGDTTATLTLGEDADGNTLANGLYGFTIDNNSPQKEYIIATVTGGTALTGIMNITRQGVASAGFANFHRKGAVVEITDWAALLRVVDALNGTINLDSGTPLSYDGAPLLNASNQLATVQYVLDHVNGGAVSFNAEIIAGMAGESISSGDWMYLKESDGRWYKTAASAPTTSVGVRLGKALGAGTTGNAIASGVFVHGLETSGTYSTHTTYYLQDTAGTVGTSAGTYSVIVGVSDGNGKLIVGETPGSYRDAMAGSLGTPSGTNKYLTADNAYTGSEDVVQNTQNSSTVVGSANSSGNRNKVAQSFIPSRSKIRGIKLYKSADTGTFTGTVSVALQADSAGSPSGSDLITTTLANAAWAAITAGAFSVDFTADLAVTPGTTYWIVISTSTADASNHPNLGIASTSVYANGTLKYNNTTDGWVTTTTDLYFSTLNGVRSQVAETDSSTGMLPTTLAPSAVVNLDATPVTVSNTTTETTLFSKVLPASATRSISGIRFTAYFSTFQVRTSGAQSMVLKAKLNGTTIATLTMSNVNTANLNIPGELEFVLFNNASLSSQSYFARFTAVPNQGNNAASNTNAIATYAGFASGTSSVDMTGGDVLFVLTATASEANASTQLVYAGSVLEKIST